MGGKIILSLVALLVVVSSRGEVYLAAGELYPSTVDIFLLAPRGNSPKQMEEMTTEWAIRYLVRKLAGEFLKGNVTSNVAVEKLATTIISLKLTGSPLTGVASKSRERPFWVYKKENRGFDGIKVLLEIGNRRVELYLARSIDAQALWNNKIRNKLRNGKRNLFLEGKVAAIVAAETKEISFFALEKTDLGRLSTIVHDLKVPFQAIGFLELFFTTEGEREEYRGRVARIRGIFGKYDEDLADPKKGLVTALANLYSTLNTIKEFCLWGHQFISATTTREATELGERNFSKALRLIKSATSTR